MSPPPPAYPFAQVPLQAPAWQALQGRSVAAIVIGTSAGGVEALSQLLPMLPTDLPVPVLVALHLPRDRRSLLVEIFGPRCALQVVEAFDKMPLDTGIVVFAPPDYHLLVDAGRPEPATAPRLALSVDAPVHYSRPAIDVLFESAADVYGERLLAILMTGANEDGAAGLQAVRQAGGMALVQDPDTAEASYMPAAALAAGPVDLVLPLARSASLLRSMRKGNTA